MTKWRELLGDKHHSPLQIENASPLGSQTRVRCIHRKKKTTWKNSRNDRVRNIPFRERASSTFSSCKRGFLPSVLSHFRLILLTSVSRSDEALSNIFPSFLPYTFTTRNPRKQKPCVSLQSINIDLFRVNVLLLSSLRTFNLFSFAYSEK